MAAGGGTAVAAEGNVATAVEQQRVAVAGTAVAEVVAGDTIPD